MKINHRFTSCLTAFLLFLAVPAAAQSSLAMQSFQERRNTINKSGMIVLGS